MESTKPIHTLVLDAGIIIKNDPSVSTLLAQSESLVTVPAIMLEIKDAATRLRIDTTLRPLLTIRDPSPSSIKFVTEFARRTGDLAVLSRPDVQIIALAYEIECERNCGDWRLRKVPGQKGLNGAPPAKHGVANPGMALSKLGEQLQETPEDALADGRTMESTFEGSTYVPQADEPSKAGDDSEAQTEATEWEHIADEQSPHKDAVEQVTDDIQRADLDDPIESRSNDSTPQIDSAQHSASSQEDSTSDSEGWITPSNLKKHQAQDIGTSTAQTPEPKTMQVAVLTTDFAMQNVIIQMNLNLLSPSLNRIKHLKTYVLRCHACFQVCRQMDKQFCPRCGQPALTRVSCSTNANGEFKLHLKKNMQWSTRGDRFSIPKPVHGSANGKVRGGGKGGWGQGLILTEDQKEYERASVQQRKAKERNLMDEDYLPSILTGDRSRAGGRIKVGAGRNVNARTR